MLTAKASIQVNKPTAVVYEAVVNPLHMSQYFIRDSTGIMLENTTVTWRFPEFDDAFPVHIIATEPNKTIIFNWSGQESQQTVRLTFTALNDESTLLKIEEGPIMTDEEGVITYGRQTEGWANFLACLKAYVEYGINLRKGAFDFMKTN
jgi:uncharacterized protein YndB with AHSA1/START domain